MVFERKNRNRDMRALAGLLTAVAFLLVSSGSVLAQADPAESVRGVIEKVRKGVVRVQVVTIDSPVTANFYGGGSGFVFEVDYANGFAYAITNHHVSGNASMSAVQFWNDAQYRAELIATEPGIDVALLKVYGIPDERGLPEEERTIVPVVLGDSDRVQIGELAVAMGNPGARVGVNIDRSNPMDDFLLQQTATHAVVTGRATPLEFMVSIWRRNQGDLGFQYGTNFDYTFRISVPISGGNSGGPLFNSRGEVIGINFYGGANVVAQNSNWAIPINLAKDFVFQSLETGRFEKPWLGLDIIMPSFIRGPEEYIEFAERYRGDEIRVFGVRADSPADRAGFQKEDIILEIDGKVFQTPEDIRLDIFDREIGSPVYFVVLRDGDEIEISAEVGPKRSYNSEFSV